MISTEFSAHSYNQKDESFTIFCYYYLYFISDQYLFIILEFSEKIINELKTHIRDLEDKTGKSFGYSPGDKYLNITLFYNQYL